ncbi:MAG: guanylate kinase [Candidatus Omnitrophica bacterium]|nr:guanylate kinase [Candidatus Omnitrophota bacterium]MDD4012775.1 guanylate kinase [Candidatus Omnitrophota bacterium]
MEDLKEPLIVVLSAPSGSGKTTMVMKVLDKLTDIRRSVSCTTREPREGEAEGDDYIFLAKEEFRDKIDRGEFIEWEENFGNYYGTLRRQVEEAIEEGDDVILSIDVKGARRVKRAFPESVSVFVMPPSREELESRIKKRALDAEEQVKLRLKESEKEIAAADEYDYLIVNDSLDKAVEELVYIISQERQNRKKQNKKR